MRQPGEIQVVARVSIPPDMITSIEIGSIVLADERVPTGAIFTLRPHRYSGRPKFADEREIQICDTRPEVIKAVERFQRREVGRGFVLARFNQPAVVRVPHTNPTYPFLNPIFDHRTPTALLWATKYYGTTTRNPDHDAQQKWLLSHGYIFDGSSLWHEEVAIESDRAFSEETYLLALTDADHPLALRLMGPVNGFPNRDVVKTFRADPARVEVADYIDWDAAHPLPV